MEKTLKLEEVYECFNLFNGLTFRNGKGEEVTITGFCNEKSISEGVRRIANKTLKKLEENTAKEQIKAIQALVLPEGMEETGNVLESLKQEKIKELFDTPIVINFEELPDWSIMNERLEEKKAEVSFNYSYIFDKLFLNY